MFDDLNVFNDQKHGGMVMGGEHLWAPVLSRQRGARVGYCAEVHFITG